MVDAAASGGPPGSCPYMQLFVKRNILLPGAAVKLLIAVICLPGRWPRRGPWSKATESLG